MNTNIEHNLTSCQHTAASGISNWAYDYDDLFATLCGAAGTGKSWLSKFILKQIPQRRVCVVAPTRQAVAHIKRVSGCDGFTVQSLLGFRPDTDVENFDPNNVKFDRKNPPKVGNYDLILLDEASMLQTVLLDYIKELAEKHSTKFLFVGDHIQLPPVGETFSPVFLKETVNGNVFKLETPCRQAMENPLFLLLLALRCDIEETQVALEYVIDHTKELNIYDMDLDTALRMKPNQTYRTIQKRFPEMYGVEDDGYCFYTDSTKFDEELMNDSVIALSNEDHKAVRALAWRNVTVERYNKMVRNAIFRIPDIITTGEIVKCYRPITRYDSSNRTTYTLIDNSEDCVIKSTTLEDAYYPGIRLYTCELESIDSLTKNNERHLISFVHPEDYDAYLSIYSTKLENARRTGRWGVFYEFFDGHLLLESLSKIKSNKRLPTKAFDYGYGLTIHKAQGSTFETVYVDTNDIKEHYHINRNYMDKRGEWAHEQHETYARITRQLLYVGLSRASKFAHILL